MTDRYFFEEGCRHFRKTMFGIYFVFFVFIAWVEATHFLTGGMSRYIIIAAIPLFLLVSIGVLLVYYGIPYSLEVVGSDLYIYNRGGEKIKELPLCELDISSLINIKHSSVDEFLKENKGVLIVFRIKGEKQERTEIGIALLSPGTVPMRKAVDFQHWLIEHIKENCPEEVYKEAVKYRIEGVGGG